MKYTSHKKIIPYQIIINFEKDLQIFQSFDEYFQALFAYFELSGSPDKQKIIKELPVNHLILIDFYHDYQMLAKKFKKEHHMMKTADVIKPQPIKG